MYEKLKIVDETMKILIKVKKQSKIKNSRIIYKLILKVRVPESVKK